MRGQRLGSVEGLHLILLVRAILSPRGLTGKGPGKGPPGPPAGGKGKGKAPKADEPRKPDLKPGGQTKKLYWNAFRMAPAECDTVFWAVQNPKP